MKNRHLFPILGLFLLFSACSVADDDVRNIPELPLLAGEATAVLNGEPITFKSYAVKEPGTNKVRIEIDVLDPENNYTRNVSFSQIPLSTGSSELFNFESPRLETRSYCYYTAASGDAVYAFYDLVEDLPETDFSLSAIETVDGHTKIIGSFNITLSIEDGIMVDDLGVTLEETIHLREGYFEAPLRN